MYKKTSPLRTHLISLLSGALVVASGIVALQAPQAAVAATLPGDPPTVTAQQLPVERRRVEQRRRGRHRVRDR
jgi:hypothetical protein